MNDGIKQNLQESSIWKRALYMLLFALFYSVAEMVLFAVVIFQFLFKLTTGETNKRLLDFDRVWQRIFIRLYSFSTLIQSTTPTHSSSGRTVSQQMIRVKVLLKRTLLPLVWLKSPLKNSSKIAMTLMMLTSKLTIAQSQTEMTKHNQRKRRYDAVRNKWHGPCAKSIG